MKINITEYFEHYLSEHRHALRRESEIVRGLREVEGLEDIGIRQPVLDSYGISLSDLTEELQLQKLEKILQVHGIIDPQVIQSYETSIKALFGYESIQNRQSRQGLSLDIAVKLLASEDIPHLELYERKGHYFTSNDGSGYDLTDFVDTQLTNYQVLCIIGNPDKKGYRRHLVFFLTDLEKHKWN